MYTIHQDDVETISLPGRHHKMIVRPENLGSKNMCLGVVEFAPNHHATANTHEESEEILYILSGHGEMYLNGKPEPIRPGTCVLIPPNVEHSVNNTGDEVLRAVFVFAPQFFPEKGD